MRRLALAPFLLVLLPACTWWSSRERVLVASEPPGASIWVDGQSTGKTTPAAIDVGGHFGGNHVIELRKRGYRTATRRVFQYTEGYTSRWIAGAFDESLPPLPIFWTAGDLVLPFGVRSAILPAEHLVVLERDDAPLLGFDLLAARAATPPAAAPTPPPPATPPTPTTPAPTSTPPPATTNGTP
ncbi:MAG: PEGA domain-containing protein [Planctomycetota bacterium]